MKTLLIISGERASSALPAFPAGSGIRVVRRESALAAGAALAAGVFDAALLLTPDWTEESALEAQRLRKALAKLPVFVATAPDRVSAAYAAGADVVLPWPDVASLLPHLAARWASFGGAGHAASSERPRVLTTDGSASPWATTPRQPSPLEVLRDFSKVLSHSLDAQTFAQQLAQQLAEILSVVRIALFLAPEPSVEHASQGGRADPRLPCAAAVGIATEVVSCLELSSDSGLGLLLTQRQGVVSRHSPHWAHEFDVNPRAADEFDALGCDTAFPIRDQHEVLGMAVVGGRITGQPFTMEELNLGYFLMGELGMALRNSRLHRMLAQNHQLLASVLESNAAGSIVVGADLRVLHANRAASVLLETPSARAPGLRDLPAPAEKALRAVVGGADVEPLFLEAKEGRMLLRFSFTPLRGGSTLLGGGRPVLALIDDWTQIQAAKQAAVENANAQLITTIAARFAHEIRNSLVPLSTHAQLFRDQRHDGHFLDSLHTSLSRETLRIRRLSDQMLFLARSEAAGEDTVSLDQALKDAFAAAQEITGRAGQLLCSGEAPLRVKGRRDSLTYALQEILANALQAAPAPSQVRVKCASSIEEGRSATVLEFTDSGPGFTAETAAHATEPFYTTRTTGVGLGLAVARKIIEDHGGRLVISHRIHPAQSDLKVILPYR